MRKEVAISFLISLILMPTLAFAESATGSGGSGLIALGAGLGIGLAALGGTLGQGKVIASTLDAIGRNPGAAGKMGLWFFVGLALVESLVILAFVIANNLATTLASHQ